MLSVFTTLSTNELCKEYTIVEDLNNLEVRAESLNAVKKRKLILKNGIQVLLICDKKTKVSACSMNVGVGSWHDPDGYAGMAHFVEHLLFMGSKKFPNENTFSQFISDNSGTCNAYTASDKTVYMFSSSNQSFFTALDIFSQFFISPLFSEGGIQRELNAVDQEHNKNLENENWREYMVLKETANKNHPFHKFSTGTAQTLNVIPRNDLIKWYETHYSSQKMHLVLYSNRSLDAQQNEILSLFGQVPIRKPSDSELPLIFDEKQKGRLIYIEPLVDEKKLSFLFELPNEIAKDVYTHSDEFLGYVLKNTAPNSLFDKLKKEQYIQSLDVDSSRLSKDSKLFCVSFELTPKGIQKHQKIVELFFSALNNLEIQSISPYIFNEYKNLKNIHHTYQSKQDPISYTSSLAASMPYESLATFPKLQKTISEYKPLMIKKLLGYLKKENCILILKGPKDLVSYNANKKEKYIGASYCINPIEISDKRLNIKLNGPIPNPYVPTNFTLENNDASTLCNPKNILNTPSITSYYAQDKFFKNPKASFKCVIASDLCVNTAKSQVLLDLFIQLSDLKTHYIQTSAHMAGLNSSISANEMNLTLDFYGFYQHMPLFVKTILSTINEMQADTATFQNICDAQKIHYQEKTKSLNILKAKEKLFTYQTKTAETETLLKTLKTINLEEFNQFCKNIFNKTSIQSLTTGPVSKGFALDLSNCVKKQCQKEIFSEFEKHTILFNPIKEKGGPYFIPIKSKQLANATFLTIQDTSKFNLQKKACMLILENILRESFFNELRTKQQTGYIVGSSSFEKDFRQFICFYVHSSSHQPQDLLSRFDLFIEERLRNFDQEVSGERFNNIKKQLASLINKPHDSLYSHSNELFSMLFKIKDIKRKEKLIDSLNSTTIKNFKNFTFQLLDKKNTARLAVLCKGADIENKAFEYKQIKPY